LFAGWLADWQAAGWLSVWMLAGCWLADRLDGWLAGWLLVDRPAGWLLTGWLCCWLAGWLTGSLRIKANTRWADCQLQTGGLKLTGNEFPWQEAVLTG
jgi:hypothetical protein